MSFFVTVLGFVVLSSSVFAKGVLLSRSSEGSNYAKLCEVFGDHAHHETKINLVSVKRDTDLTLPEASVQALVAQAEKEPTESTLSFTPRLATITVCAYTPAGDCLELTKQVPGRDHSRSGPASETLRKLIDEACR